MRWSFFGCFAVAAAGLPCRGSVANPNPLTMPNTAGITISVSSVDEIMPPIIGTAIRCVISEPVPVLHMIGSSPAMIRRSRG